MKIKFNTLAIDMTAKTFRDAFADYTLQIEGTDFSVDKLAPLFKKLNVAYVSGAANAQVFAVWLDFPVVIQSVKDDVGNVIPFEYLDQQREVVYKNFNEVQVNEFQKGKIYTIPVSAGTPTDCNPDLDVYPVARASTFGAYGGQDCYVPLYYSYVATEQQDVRGGQSFTGLMCDFIPAAIATNIAISAPRKAALNEVLGASLIKTRR